MWPIGRRSVPPAERDTATRTERLAEALERARAGDTSGLDDIVRELSPLLWHVARSQGVDRAEVADVVQHSWLELVSRLDGIRSPSALTAWLVTTTKREAWRLDRRRELLRVVAMVERPDYAVVSEALGMPHGSIGPTRGRCLSKLRALLLADASWQAS